MCILCAPGEILEVEQIEDGTVLSVFFFPLGQPGNVYLRNRDTELILRSLCLEVAFVVAVTRIGCPVSSEEKSQTFFVF